MQRAVAYVHAALIQIRERLVTDGRKGTAAGQGTVEYVALILLVALVMAGVVAAMRGFRTHERRELGHAIIRKIKDAVGKVQF